MNFLDDPGFLIHKTMSKKYKILFYISSAVFFNTFEFQNSGDLYKFIIQFRIIQNVKRK